MKTFDPLKRSPPKNIEFEALIINDFGFCDLEWKKIKFDSILPPNTFRIYDDQDKYIGKIYIWRYINEKD